MSNPLKRSKPLKKTKIRVDKNKVDTNDPIKWGKLPSKKVMKKKKIIKSKNGKKKGYYNNISDNISSENGARTNK